MSLETPIKNFEFAVKGSAMRSALVSLLTALIEDTNYTASYLSYYNADEFLKKDELQREYEPISNALNYILSEEVDDTVYNRLSSISSIKDQIREAVNGLYNAAKIPTTGEDSYFENYAVAISEIPEELDVRTISSTTIEENGTYEAQEGSAYTPIIVAVPEKTLTTRVIKKNGTYYAEQDGADGYEYVQVAVTGSVEGYTVRFFSEDGQNILYTAMDVPLGGYATFTGEYPTHEGLFFAGWNPEPKNIQQDTDCYPTFSELPTSYDQEISDSWETIIANHGAGYPIGSYKNIVFPSETSITFTGPKPHWIYQSSSSQPNYGKYYMWMSNTYKNFYPWKMVKVASGEGGTTSTWVSVGPPMADTIVYNTGWAATARADGVAEFTTNSTVTGQVACIPGLYFYYHDGESHRYSPEAYSTSAPSIVYTGQDRWGWDTSDLRAWLNNEFFAILPTIIKNGIKSVPKTSSVVDLSKKEVLSEVRTRDKLWVISVKEFFGFDPNSIYFAINTSPSYEDQLKKYYKKISSNGIMTYKEAMLTGQTITVNNRSASEIRHPWGGDIYFRDVIESSSGVPRAYHAQIRQSGSLYLNSGELYDWPEYISGATLIGFCL